MGARGAELSPVSSLDLQRQQALSTIGQTGISLEWLKEGLHYGYLSDSDLVNSAALAKTQSVFEVAIHEWGHAAVARDNGWDVEEISVVPNGNVLGVTKSRPRYSRSFRELLSERIAIAAGGEAAESIYGKHDHSGAGSDRGSARFYARILAMVTGDSEGSILSRAMSTARRSIASFGIHNLRINAWKLVQQQII